MKLGIISAGIVVILAGPASADARAQTDSIGGRVFRDAVTEIARASNLPRLDSAALLPGVRREIRIYEGFGFTCLTRHRPTRASVRPQDWPRESGNR